MYIQDSEAIPEPPTKKSKPSVDSGAHCSKDLVKYIFLFIFIIMFTFKLYRHQVIGMRLFRSLLTTQERYV